MFLCCDWPLHSSKVFFKQYKTRYKQAHLVYREFMCPCMRYRSLVFTSSLKSCESQLHKPVPINHSKAYCVSITEGDWWVSTVSEKQCLGRTWRKVNKILKKRFRPAWNYAGNTHIHTYTHTAFVTAGLKWLYTGWLLDMKTDIFKELQFLWGPKVNKNQLICNYLGTVTFQW